MMLVRLQLDACQPACTYYWCMCWCSSSVYNAASYKVVTTPFSTQIRQWVLCVYSNEASNMGGVLWNSINVRFIILLPSMFSYISKQNPYHEMKKMGINGFQKFVVCDINNTTAFKIVQDLLQLEHTLFYSWSHRSEGHYYLMYNCCHRFIYDTCTNTTTLSTFS